jgi:hypothetical protein
MVVIGKNHPRKSPVTLKSSIFGVEDIPDIFVKSHIHRGNHGARRRRGKDAA